MPDSIENKEVDRVICPCKIQDIGIMPSVDYVFATIIFDKNCPTHGHIGRKAQLNHTHHNAK